MKGRDSVRHHRGVSGLMADGCCVLFVIKIGVRVTCNEAGCSV